MRTVSPVHADSPLPILVRDGVLVRTAGRLRVSSRALAHAERAAAQAALHGGPAGLEAALGSALRACGYGGDVPAGAAYLAEFLAERGQLGALQPVFGTARLGIAA
ncbi:MAG: hypothetical protein ABR562_02580 [Thermoplasmatota archaeon]